MLKTKVLKEGPGVPIVFLHGFLGRSEDWLEVCASLPPCRCIGIDLPGHGDSPFEPDFTIDLPQFHLVGYSMGGRIALQKFKDKALTLTLLSTHPGLKDAEERDARRESDAVWAKKLLHLPIDEFLKQWYDQPIFKPFINRDGKKVTICASEATPDQSEAGRVSGVNSKTIDPRARIDMAKPQQADCHFFTAPVNGPRISMRREQNVVSLAKALLHFSLAHQPRFEIDHVIVGERDLKFKTLFLNPIVVPGAGHMVHLENPKAIAKIIEERVKL